VNNETIATPDAHRDISGECAEFLYREAELLDHRDFTSWIDCLAEDLVYLMPVRVTRGPEARDIEFSPQAFHMKENYASLKMRVSRLHTQHAYAEDPPSRTQRLITNVRVAPVSDPVSAPAVNSAGDDLYDVRSNFMCYRAQGQGVNYDMLVGERYDMLRDTADGWRLAKRVIHLAHTTLLTANLGIFL
jgi:3-phenylpropionate/cinnamic acid dioxygenase small subunit